MPRRHQMRTYTIDDNESIEVPEWIDADSLPDTLTELRSYCRDICHGGCASGVYMPAVTYHTAKKTMGEHGDDVLEYIEEHLGEIPAPPTGSAWCQISVYYLSMAVELWAFTEEG